MAMSTFCGAGSFVKIVVVSGVFILVPYQAFPCRANKPATITHELRERRANGKQPYLGTAEKNGGVGKNQNCVEHERQKPYRHGRDAKRMLRGCVPKEENDSTQKREERQGDGA